MRFEWDENRRLANIRKHQVDFEDVLPLFKGPLRVESDRRRDYGEERYRGIGCLGLATLVVIFTEPMEGVIRLISARKAERHERESFEAEIGKNRH